MLFKNFRLAEGSSDYLTKFPTNLTNINITINFANRYVFVTGRPPEDHSMFRADCLIFEVGTPSPIKDGSIRKNLWK